MWLHFKMILNIINQNNQEIIETCLNSMNKNDVILFIGEATSMLFNKNFHIKIATQKCYILQNELEGKAIDQSSVKNIQSINYIDFVNMVTASKKCITW